MILDLYLKWFQAIFWSDYDFVCFCCDQLFANFQKNIKKGAKIVLFSNFSVLSSTFEFSMFVKILSK